MVAIPAAAGGGAAPGAPAAAGGPASSPATQATQNPGAEAQGLAKLRVVVDMLARIQVELGANSEVGQAVNKAIGQLGKFIPPGMVTPGAASNQLDGLQRQAMQAGPQVAAMRQAAAGGQ